MQVCPRCKLSRPSEEVFDRDPKTGRRWLITRCKTCHFNYDLQEWNVLPKRDYRPKT